MLHLEIIQERLEREFDMTVITTVPNVSYHAFTNKNPDTVLLLNNPSDLPEPSKLNRVEEPFIKATIITKSDFVGPVMSLCIEKRGQVTNQTYLTPERVELTFEMPLAELRQARQMTQEQIAHTLKIKQASVSKMESQTDMYISTMRKYVEAMGGELEIVAKFPDGNVKVDNFKSLEA